MDTDQTAQLAMSLRDNEVFQAALDNLRSGALEALAKVATSDQEAIHHQQAIVKVVDEIRSDLDAFIRTGKPRAKPGLA
jgi:hypothetical protein